MNATMKRITRKALAFFAGMAAVALIQSTPAQAFQFTFQLQDMTSVGTPVFYSSWQQMANGVYANPPGSGGSQFPILYATVPYIGGSYLVSGGTYNMNKYLDGSLLNSSTSVYNATSVQVMANVQLAGDNFTDLLAGIHMIAQASPFVSTAAGGSILARFYYDQTGLVNTNANPGSGNSNNAASYKPIAGYGAPIWTTPLYAWANGSTPPQNLPNDVPVVGNNPYGMAVEFDLLLNPGAGVQTRVDSMNSVVPEPTTYVLLGLSIGVIGFARRKMVRNA